MRVRKDHLKPVVMMGGLESTLESPVMEVPRLETEASTNQPERGGRRGGKRGGNRGQGRGRGRGRGKSYDQTRSSREDAPQEPRGGPPKPGNGRRGRGRGKQNERSLIVRQSVVVETDAVLDELSLAIINTSFESDQSMNDMRDSFDEHRQDIYDQEHRTLLAQKQQFAETEQFNTELVQTAHRDATLLYQSTLGHIRK